MARKTAPSVAAAQPPAELTVSREDAKARLQDRIEKGFALKNLQIVSGAMFNEAKDDYHKWNAFNHELLRRLFTTDEFAREYDNCAFGIVTLFREPSVTEEMSQFEKDLDEKIRCIESIIERVELISLGSSHPAPEPPQVSQLRQSASKKVFVVHGHDEAAKTSLEVLLREIGLDPVVLHRQADVGQTVIEKFEKHSDVDYAFILLTPDEVAYLRSEEEKEDKNRKKELRARPNVIFEFGYFVGKLGRSRVCCLYTGDVSLPSDVNGMIYKRYQNSIEEVAYSIIKDLKASGYAVGH